MSEDRDPTREQTYEQGVDKLERELAFARRNGARATRQMHALLIRELREAERALRRARSRGARLKRQAEQAKAEARLATRRACAAERELAEIKASRTWKAGRAIGAVPARLKRLGRG